MFEKVRQFLYLIKKTLPVITSLFLLTLYFLQDLIFNSAFKAY